jgi:hypothetical protein
VSTVRNAAIVALSDHALDEAADYEARAAKLRQEANELEHAALILRAAHAIANQMGPRVAVKLLDGGKS